MSGWMVVAAFAFSMACYVVAKLIDPSYNAFTRPALLDSFGSTIATGAMILWWVGK